MINKDKNNSEFIKKSTPYGIAIFIVLSVGVFLLLQGSKEIGILLSGLSLLALFMFYIVFIPNAQQMYITDKALVINAYNYHRSYYWYQIYDVYLSEENSSEVIIKISKNLNDNKNKEVIPYIDVPINTQVFGHDPKELIEEIKKKIQ